MSGLVIGGLVLLGFSLLVGTVAAVSGLPRSSRLTKAPRAWEAAASGLGLEFSDKLVITGELDGIPVEVRRHHRDRNSGMGFQTQVRVGLELSREVGLDTGADASILGMMGLGRGELLSLGDPVFDERVRVWGDETSARVLLTQQVRQAILDASQRTRILLLGGVLLGEYEGLVKDEAVMTRMIRATVDVALSVDPRRYSR